MKKRGMAADFEGLENDVLDGILWHFYAEVRNADGQLYSKSTFVDNLRASIRGRPFDSEGRGAWQIWSGQNVYFQHELGRKII